MLTLFPGYVKSSTPSMIGGYTAPVRLASYIYGPHTDGHFIGEGDYFPGTTDPLNCALRCNRITKDARIAAAGSTYRACNYFNSWEAEMESGGNGLVCYYYDQPQLVSDAVGPETGYKVRKSYAWSRDPQDPGQVS